MVSFMLLLSDSRSRDAAAFQLQRFVEFESLRGRELGLRPPLSFWVSSAIVSFALVATEKTASRRAVELQQSD